MAELTNKLHLKKDDVVFDCVCYTTAEEATPVAISGGNSWEIKNNGVVCYVGLWPVFEGDGEYHSPLKVKKNDVEYFVETQVARLTMVNIVQSEHQTIKVTYNGDIYTDSFEAIIGTQFSVVVEPEVGYTAGAPSVSAGYVTKGLVITASPASKAKYLVTIEQAEGVTVTVTCNGVEYTSSFTAEYGDTWTAKVVSEDGYRVIGTTLDSGGTITGNTVIKVPEAEKTMYALTGFLPDKASLTINGLEGGTYGVIHGTEVQIESHPEQYYTTDAIYLDVARLIVYRIGADVDLSLITSIHMKSEIGDHIYNVSDLNQDRELKSWVDAEFDTTITTETVFPWNTPDIVVESGVGTATVSVEELRYEPYREVVIAPPFTDNQEYLTNLVDNEKISITSDYLKTNSNFQGYIEFTTPMLLDDTELSITVAGAGQTSSRYYFVAYVGTNIYYPTASKAMAGITDGNGNYVCYTKSSVVDWTTYEVPSGLLQPNTKYYLSISGNSGSSTPFGISEIKFNVKAR